MTLSPKEMMTFPVKKDSTLQEAAARSLENAYAPYTKLRIGLAIRLSNGTVYTGCSFENAAFMHGIEPLEGAVGKALIEERWAFSGQLPLISSLCYSFEAVPSAPDTFYPGPLSLMLLRLFANDGTKIAYATADGIFANHKASELMNQPQSSFDMKSVLEKAKSRAESQATANFSGAPLNSLFATRLQAFCPISHYAVGAMVETESGGRYFGCNLEPGGNKGIHAEGVALATMVDQEGPRARIKKVTILTGGRPGFPCGGCRQHINEFATDETKIVCMNLEGEAIASRHHDLLPSSFGRLDLGFKD